MLRSMGFDASHSKHQCPPAQSTQRAGEPLHRGKPKRSPLCVHSPNAQMHLVGVVEHGVPAAWRWALPLTALLDRSNSIAAADRTSPYWNGMVRPPAFIMPSRDPLFGSRSTATSHL